MSYAKKYRPKTVEEVIGQPEITEVLKEQVDKGINGFNIHLLLEGKEGTGKTSLAIAIARELFGDNYLGRFREFNASDERGIKVVREKIKLFAKTPVKKIIFLTEFDQMTNDAQHALRRIMEQYEKYTIFIIDCNYPERIIPAIKSRCAIFSFKPIDNKIILNQVMSILVKENVEFNAKSQEFRNAILTLVKLRKGDLRGAINQIEVLVTKNKTINVKNVLALQPTKEARSILNLALNGDLDNAIKEAEVYLAQKNNGSDYMFSVWSDMLLEAPAKEEDEQKRAIIKAMNAEIYYEMTLCMDRCNRNEPIYQINGFLMFAWKAPSLIR